MVDDWPDTIVTTDSARRRSPATSALSRLLSSPRARWIAAGLALVLIGFPAGFALWSDGEPTAQRLTVEPLPDRWHSSSPAAAEAKPALDGPLQGESERSPVEQGNDPARATRRDDPTSTSEPAAGALSMAAAIPDPDIPAPADVNQPGAIPSPSAEPALDEPIVAVPESVSSAPDIGGPLGPRTTPAGASAVEIASASTATGTMEPRIQLTRLDLPMARADGAVEVPAPEAPVVEGAQARQSPDDESTVRRGDLVRLGDSDVARPTMTIEPHVSYPHAARRLRRETTVRLRVLINEEGLPARIESVGERAGLGFDEAAHEAIAGARWQPATKDGVPVKVWIQTAVHFQLDQ